MPTSIDALLKAYEKVLIEPWNVPLSGQEKTWFLVFDPADLRKVEFRISDFERITRQHNKEWVEFPLNTIFQQWISQHEYRDEYFADPEIILDQVEEDFIPHAASLLNKTISEAPSPSKTVFALTRVSALFGFENLKVSTILESVYDNIEGRLLLFFPGQFQDNHYRLMDARDGWSYHARPIIA